ncbi:CDP-glycerol glycerophosphotransferase family protein [Arthrobacter rhombi]|uniref:CDP-glycerol glycerophosphotransferase family protein n=1 Tax=Arthrobacter rhombi TaxID=71253 RepID=UPI003FCF5651
MVNKVPKRIATMRQRANRLIGAQLKDHWLQDDINETAVLYESYSGNGMICNPEALFRHLLALPEFQHLSHIWVLNNFQRYASTIEEFRDNPNVKFVRYGSLDYYRVLATSKYLINNVSFPAQFVKRPEQIYVNTWHGVPLKKMGYDIQGRAVDAKNIIRNFLAADYLLSSSPAMTERMYLGAFKLRNLYRGKILEEGSPRTDRQTDYGACRTELQTRLRQSGSFVDSREILLYAPTWRGGSYFNPVNDAANLRQFVRSLEQQIDTTKYRVLVKAHQIVSDAVGRDRDLAKYIVPNDVPTNVVLGASAVLITDYSSIFYDFLALGRPVLFYVPDLEDYRSYRDLYAEPEEFAGPVLQTLEDLASELTEILESASYAVSDKYLDIKKRFAGKDDGGVCERITDIVFRGDSDKYSIRENFVDGRQRVLMYIGGMLPNGITTSALNLLDNIDYSRFDVTVLCPFSEDPEKQRNFAQVNPQARLMFRFGNFTGAYLPNWFRLRVLRDGDNHWASRLPMVRRLWQQEWTRCFGSARFDHMIDFSGYAPFWGNLLLSGPQATRSIWLHNDLAADALRSIDGNQPLKAGLLATFSNYKYFDNLVSVSSGLSSINQEALRQWAPSSRFRSAANTVNARKILELASIESRSLEKAAVGVEGSAKSSGDELGRIVQSLLAPGNEQHHESHGSRSYENCFTSYITVGRLSPEKNHARLIEAFAQVHGINPQTRLVIVGDGPLRDYLQSLVLELGLFNAVKLVGQTPNPYQLMAHADVFVLSSDYEGQPMVLLEALVLGLPVITTSFGSVNGALPLGVGTVVDPNIQDLSRAMLEFLEAPPGKYPFDGSIYNARAVSEFERIASL